MHFIQPHVFVKTKPLRSIITPGEHMGRLKNNLTGFWNSFNVSYDVSETHIKLVVVKRETHNSSNFISSSWLYSWLHSYKDMNLCLTEEEPTIPDAHLNATSAGPICNRVGIHIKNLPSMLWDLSGNMQKVHRNICWYYCISSQPKLIHFETHGCEKWKCILNISTSLNPHDRQIKNNGINSASSRSKAELGQYFWYSQALH